MARLTSSEIRGWLEPQLPSDVFLSIGNRMPDMPDRIVAVSIQPGAGLIYEGQFDQPALAIRCRGGSENYEDAEFIAYSVDDVFLTAGHPLSMGSVWVTAITRLSGAPAELEQADSQLRTVFTAEYVLTASTGVFG